MLLQLSQQGICLELWQTPLHKDSSNYFLLFYKINLPILPASKVKNDSMQRVHSVVQFDHELHYSFILVPLWIVWCNRVLKTNVECLSFAPQNCGFGNIHKYYHWNINFLDYAAFPVEPNILSTKFLWQIVCATVITSKQTAMIFILHIGDWFHIILDVLFMHSSCY